MDLREFVSEYADHSQRVGKDLIDSGPASKRLFETIGNEGKTRSLLATNFWRAWLYSDIAISFMAALGASRGVLSRSRAIIVSRDDVSRFDLLVLDPELPQQSMPTSIGANLRGAMRDAIMQGAVRAFGEGEIPLLGTEGPQLAVEVARDGELPAAVILASEPGFERLSVPASPLAITAALTSTAGMLVEDRQRAGRLGVTAALHGIDPATSVNVAGQTGTVVRTDTVTDSAFVELSPFPSVGVQGTNGVMSGMTPRGSQKATFVGVTSNASPTIITGWDAQVPTPSSRRQACIYTKRDAQPGDSGAALVTDDNWVVGFAFERTQAGAVPENCSWIWADSVLNRLNVKPA
jgi:hypothetical protein